MKLYSSVFLAAVATSVLLLTENVSAFSAVAPKSTTPATGSKLPNLDPVDKTLDGIDAEGSFDPTDGDNAAIQRNNKDEVWVPQVRKYINNIIFVSVIAIIA